MARPKIKFISFASEGFEAPMQRLLESARRHGADEVRGWTRADLRQLDIYPANRAILDAPRGAGYWAWKPIIILEELRAMSSGDVLIYNDGGRAARGYEVDRPLHEVVDWVVNERSGMLPGIFVPQWGPNEQWTKGECFVAMGCDTPAIRRHPQVQATFSVWQAHDRSRAFVQQWVDWCLNPQAVADERVDPSIPDAPTFADHRHDQSILTNLVLRQGMRLFGDPRETVVGPYRDSLIQKDIGTLADRIAGRTWSIRRRLAREQFGQRDFGNAANGALVKLERAVWYLRALDRARRAYPGKSGMPAPVSTVPREKLA